MYPDVRDKEAFAVDYHETCDKADRYAAMGLLEEALKLWRVFYDRWKSTT